MAAENIAKAIALKETGNEAFKRGDYKQAMISYHQVRALHAHRHGRAQSHRHRRHRSTCTCTASRRGRGVA